VVRQRKTGNDDERSEYVRHGAQRAGEWCETGAHGWTEWIRESRPERLGQVGGAGGSTVIRSSVSDRAAIPYRSRWDAVPAASNQGGTAERDPSVPDGAEGFSLEIHPPEANR